MSSISVKWQTANAAKEMFSIYRVELSGVIASVRNIKSNRCMTGRNFTAVYRALDKAISDMEEQKANIKNLQDGLSEVLKAYDTYENRISGQIQGGVLSGADVITNWSKSVLAEIKKIFGNVATEALWKNVVKILGTGALIGGTVCNPYIGAVANWAQKLGESAQGVFGNIIQGNGTAESTQGTEGITSQNTGAESPVISESGAPAYKLPDYVFKGLERVNGVFGPCVWWRDGGYGAVYEYNDEAETELSCTYYTLRKLNERGLSFPCVKGPGSGKQWYGNFDTETELPRYGGNSALRDLANNLTMPQENIVVSFEPGTDTTHGDAGHVLLIDKIYRDENGAVRVEWSDQNPPISDINGYNPQQNMSLEGFIQKYSNPTYYGGMNGAVVIGAGRN